MKRKISYYEFIHKDEDIHHAPFIPEMAFYEAIKNGEVEKVRELCSIPITQKTGLGILSKNKLQNMKYHFTISTAEIARVCIKGGLSHSEGYTKSDYYIQLADECTSLEELSTLHTEMCIDYVSQMKIINKKTIYSKAINKCINYIYENLNTRITVPVLAETCGLSQAYLSKLFKKETGETISEYIMNKKLETAKNMLQFSEYSLSEISFALNFPSQSYFSNAFKKSFGCTPGNFRHYSKTP